MSNTPATPLPTSETDSWESTSTEAPRQKAGEVIGRQSEDAEAAPKNDRADEERMAADAERLAERQAADGGSADKA